MARRAAGRERAAMERVLSAVGPAMLRVVRSILGPGAPDLEDVLQEAVEGLLVALQSFEGHCTVRHFACRVAVLSALAWRRRVRSRARWMRDLPDADLHAAPHEPSPADRLLSARRGELLETLLDELPEAQAEVLVLHCALDFTVEEIAISVGRPIETIRSRLRLAKRALRERIGASAELAEMLGMRP